MAEVRKVIGRPVLGTGLVIAVFVLVVVAARPVDAFESAVSSFVTTGVGEVRLVAESAVVSVDIETRAADAGQAQAENERRAAQIQEALARWFAANDATASPGDPAIDVQRRALDIWTYQGALQEVGAGFRVVSGLNIKTSDFKRIGEIVRLAMDNGATGVQGVWFTSDKVADAAREAIGLAVKDAMARAEVISKATGMRIVAIRQVSDANDIRVLNPAGPGGTAQQSVEASKLLLVYSRVWRGEILVQASVTVQFEVSRK